MSCMGVQTVVKGSLPSWFPQFLHICHNKWFQILKHTQIIILFTKGKQLCIPLWRNLGPLFFYWATPEGSQAWPPCLRSCHRIWLDHWKPLVSFEPFEDLILFSETSSCCITPLCLSWFHSHDIQDFLLESRCHAFVSYIKLSSIPSPSHNHHQGWLLLWCS